MAAARAISGVLDGRSLSDTLEQIPAGLRPAAQALSFHAMRTLGLARALSGLLVRHRPKDGLTEALLLLGISLLDASHRNSKGQSQPAGTPIYQEHVLVHQLVEAADRNRRTSRARNMLNAVLRRFGRERDTLLAAVAGDETAQWNHPGWWIGLMRDSWPHDWQQVLDAARHAPPMSLRVNTKRISRTGLLQQIRAAGMDATPSGKYGLIMDAPRPVRGIPGFEQGWWSVQDTTAQLAACLLPLQDGQRVLDACAAPGGKTAHMLELCRLQLTALDSDAGRLARVAANLQRLGLDGPEVHLLCGDAANPSEWWDGRAYDAILADVPCTASGVVRRHPDIRWLRRADDVRNTAALQARILDGLWPLLAPGGHLLYATCSVFPQEGEMQIEGFVRRHPHALRLDAPGHILPGATEPGDGFYYALLRKAPA